MQFSLRSRHPLGPARSAGRARALRGRGGQCYCDAKLAQKVEDMRFYCVANMPGAVPRTSTYALTNATLPYTIALADKGWQQACRDDAGLAKGLNTHAGLLTNAPVGEAVGIEAREPAEVLN